MTRDQVEGRRIWGALRFAASPDCPQRFHPPANYVRFDLWLLEDDVHLLNDLCTALERCSVRRLPRAAVGRALLTRAIRLAAGAAQVAGAAR